MARKPRTRAERAHAEAERLIEEARRAGATELDLSGYRTDALRALDHIPESLADIPGLTWVDLSRTQVTDLTPLARLPALATLVLGGTRVIDLSPLAHLPALAALDLRRTQVADLTPLAHLPALAELFLADTPVTDLTPLAHLPALAALDLDSTEVTDLTPLAHLPALSVLGLGGTPVTNLTPLAHLPALARLDLDSTPVTDLTPLANLTRIEGLDIASTGVTRDGLLALRPLRRLVTAPGQKDYPAGMQGLHLTGCAATREDKRIAEIADIVDPSERARALFEHLGIWEEDGAGEGTEVPEPDPGLPTVIVDGRIEVAPDEPSEIERDDAVKRAVHPRLLEKAQELAALARNRLPRLNRRAQALHRLLDCPFDKLDLLAIHFEVEDLNHRAARGEEDGEAYGDEVEDALADIARLGPGLTRDNAAVEQHEKRLARTRAASPPQHDVDVRAAASAAILAHPAAHGPRSLELERAMADASDPVRADTIRQSKHRNMLWRLAVTVAGNLSLGVAGNHVYTVFSNEIDAFVRSSWSVLVAVAETLGASFASWFVVATVGAAVMGKGVVDEWKKRQGKNGPTP